MKTCTYKSIPFVLAAACLVPDGGLLAGNLAVTQPLPAFKHNIGNTNYTPEFFYASDPTGWFEFGLQPVFIIKDTFLELECDGAATLVLKENPGTNALSFAGSSGHARMNLGMQNGLNVQFIFSGYGTFSGSLKPEFFANFSFADRKDFSSCLLNSPVQLSHTERKPVISINFLPEILELFDFPLPLPEWVAALYFDVNADITLAHSIRGRQISFSGGAVSAEGQAVDTYVNGLSYPLQGLQETWQDTFSLSPGVSADLRVRA